MNRNRSTGRGALESAAPSSGSLSEKARQRFTGNTSFYIFQARHRQRVFLTRNIDVVLRENTRAAAATRESNENSGEEPESSVQQLPKRRKIGINNAMCRLKPTIKVGGGDEPVLKIEAKSLKRLRMYKPRQSGAALNLQNGLASNESPMSFQCRCDMTISQKVETSVRERQPRSLGSIRPLFSNNEMCTVTIESDDTATIEMENPFYVKVNKLFVFTSRSASRDFRLAESYTATFALLPTDPNCPWPPLLHNSQTEEDDPLSAHLVATITSLPLQPTTPWHEMKIEIGNDSRRADISIELDCCWSVPNAISQRTTEGRRLQPPRLPTPISEQGREASQNAQNTMTFYHFSGMLDTKYYDQFGEPNNRGQHSFSAPGFICPFCDGREFSSCNFLHFHLVTSHELFTFKVKQRKATSGIRGGGENVDQILDIIVDLAKETTVNRASDNVPDHRTFQWVRPAINFEMNKILKGDWTWLNEKKGTSAGALRRCTSDEPARLTGPKAIDLDNVLPIPPKICNKLIIPQPKTTKKGPIFIRNKSKRYIEPGEVLSESDDDVDEEWLKMMHDDTLDDFTDLTNAEHEFMKLWDKHMLIERPLGYCHMPHVLIRFANANGSRLASSHLLVEFWKHLLNLVQYKVIDTLVLKRCMEIVKGGKSEWSSVDKSQWGIGFEGHLPLDHFQGRQESPTPMSRRRSNSRRTSKGKARQMINPERMDIDGGTDSDGPVKYEVMDFEVVGMTSVPPPGPMPTTPGNGGPIMNGYGICICGRGWDRTDMIRCDGKLCPSRWFHRSCFEGVERRQNTWSCPRCKAASEKEAAAAENI